MRAAALRAGPPRPPFNAERALGPIGPLVSEAVRLHLRGPFSRKVLYFGSNGRQRPPA